jgi:outer membrane protein OmpA-like peptidoglycan-associated protein
LITYFHDQNMQKTNAITTTLVTILSLSVLPCVFAQSYTIRQEMFTCKMEMAQAVTDDTFVITRLHKGPQRGFKNRGSEQPAGVGKISNTDLAVAHFKLGSSALSTAEKESILQAISKRNNIDRHTPLIITGYTCELGSDFHNQTLSVQRANAVARVLRANGFSVATVQGKGSMSPVTNDPSQLYRNRRVEISTNRHGRRHNNDTAPLL